MASTSLFARTKEYIGRDDVLDTIKAVFRRVEREPICAVLYIESEGGLGKTYLLQQAATLLRTPAQTERVARIIDLSDSATRNDIALEEYIVDGLPTSDRAGEAGADAEPVQAFTRYHQARERYEKERRSFLPSELAARRAALRQEFVEEFNALTAQHPITLLFDTVETLISAPPANAFLSDVFPTTVSLVEEWMESVLPQLQHTMVIICGRPVSGGSVLYRLCERNQLLGAPKIVLQPLAKADIGRYLIAYGRAQPTEQEIEQAYRRTEGHPLLLTCFAQSRTNPQLLLSSEEPIDSRASFERFVLGTLLNPLVLRQRRNFRQQLLGYCLYILSYARRGLTSAQLVEFLRRHDYPLPHNTFTPTQMAEFNALIASLPDVALVKPRPKTHLLYLHDEVYHLLDHSGMPTSLDLRDEVLDYLVAQAQQQVSAAEERTERAIAIANLVYYELMRDVGHGYRQYLIAMLRLFDARDVDQALGLRDEFWRWLAVEPNREQLAESALSFAEVGHDDAVWLVRYYLGINDADQAVAIGQQIRAHFADELDTDDYFKVDLFLALGQALTLDADADQSEALRLFEQAITVLNKPTANRAFLREHIDYVRGAAYTQFGYAYRTLRDYHRARAYYIEGRRAYQSYGQSGAAAFDVIEPFTQATINLAYIEIQQGDPASARALAQELLADSFPKLSPGRQASVLNINSIIQMNGLGDLAEALRFANQAWEIAVTLQNKRLHGQVAAQIGVLKREQMRVRGEPDYDAAHFFRHAENMFTSESTSLRETLLEHGRYERDLALLFRASGAADAAVRHLGWAFECFTRALAESPDPTLLRAELLEGLASVHRLRGEAELAAQAIDEAEALLCTDDLPVYAQLVAGMIAFERGCVALDQHQTEAALRAFGVALARGAAFSSRSQPVIALRMRIQETLVARLTDESAAVAQQFLSDETAPQIRAADLPYQIPDSPQWDDDWRNAVGFLRGVISAAVADFSLLKQE